MGQHELNIEYTKLLEMADRHILMKQCIKEVAEKNNHVCTFMAKPYTEEAGRLCQRLLSGDITKGTTSLARFLAKKKGVLLAKFFY